MLGWYIPGLSELPLGHRLLLLLAGPFQRFFVFPTFLRRFSFFSFEERILVFSTFVTHSGSSVIFLLQVSLNFSTDTFTFGLCQFFSTFSVVNLFLGGVELANLAASTIARESPLGSFSDRAQKRPHTTAQTKPRASDDVHISQFPF